MSYPWFLLSLLLLLTVWEDADADASFAGCAATGLCCQGKNNTCRIGQPRNISAVDGGGDKDDNSVFVAAKRHSCFCDSACVDLSDCCHDYLQTCPRKFTRQSL